MTLSKLLGIAGLTNYQSSLFLCILKNKNSDAKHLSKLANVPIGRIYSELDVLEKQQLVDISSDRPKKYSIESPREKIIRLIEAEKVKLEDLEKNALTEYVTLSKKSAEVFSANNEVKQSQIDCFRWAKEEICQCLGSLHKPSESRDLKLIYEKEIVSAVNKGVIFKALYQKGQVPPNCIIELNKKSPDKFQIRYSEVKLPRFEIIDSNQILLKVQDPTDTTDTLGTVIINDIVLAKKLRLRFMSMWDDCEVISDDVKK